MMKVHDMKIRRILAERFVVPRMKQILPILLIESFIAYFVFYPMCNHRREQVYAFAAWYVNPTPQTRSEFERQKRITIVQNLGFATFVFVLMAAPTVFVASLQKRMNPPVLQDSQNDG